MVGKSKGGRGVLGRGNGGVCVGVGDADEGGGGGDETSRAGVI